MAAEKEPKAQIVMAWVVEDVEVVGGVSSHRADLGERFAVKQ